MYCYATPTNIMVGETATIYYQAVNATAVSISGIGAVGTGTGSIAVTPSTTTNYTITATGATTPASCSVAVTVAAGALPRIIQFSANPASIASGQSSTLVWVVDNATHGQHYEPRQCSACGFTRVYRRPRTLNTH